MRTDKKNPIDVVVLYVDGSDPVWQKQYKDCGYDISESSGARFRSNNQFMYLFRALTQYAPFVNRVFLVVSTESQVPNWINRDKVTIVTHDQIIPKELLPTFNSGTIELFIHNIPELSEQFIYCNDDMFFFAPTTPSDFFIDGKACIKFQIRNLKTATTMFRKMCLKDLELVKDYNVYPAPPEGKYYTPYHVAAPMLKSINKQVFDEHTDKIMNSCTRKRNEKNLTQYIYTESLVFKGMSVDRMPSHKYIEYTPKKHNEKEIYNFILHNKIKLFCINDTKYTPQNIRDEIVKCFSKRFPNPCKYENDTVNTVEEKPNIINLANNETKMKTVVARKFYSYS